MLTQQIIDLYRKERKLGFMAMQALRNAKTRAQWYLQEDTSEIPEEMGAVRLRIVPDDCPDLSFLDQDCSEDCRKREYDRANNDGVWGVIGEYWDGKEWQHADSCWGFIGNDWQNSGYDTDIMHSTLVAADKASQANEFLICP